MHVRHFVAAMGLSTLAMTSYAESRHFAQLPSLSQPEFRLLSSDLGAVLSNQPLGHPAPLSTSGFDVGFEVSATRLTHAQTYRLATDSNRQTLYTPRVHLNKGLPYGFGVGASYSTLPGSDLHMLGAEARYALVPDSAFLPTLGLRASYSTLRGSDWLAINTRGVDFSVSKGFSLFTPYAGVGSIWVDSDPYEGLGLAKERFHHEKYFVGANFNLRVMNFAVEADRTGDTTSYHAKFGWRW